ncbi:hypothetical protein P171DRAFT_457819 [Karstenula rhodostoma CBS 690.94]|uniref:Zn(2)-C6 fungal-type domain-containing protein n=1 Tax=Karstenula rhodostoma CBS 690.94 TaxID=1392251 RepID=A0A9P4U6G1_9PLEO|nr:hypothetical protein P171DRAFT_457819 [Karstenula rhodostoma CBS 690.94]
MPPTSSSVHRMDLSDDLAPLESTVPQVKCDERPNGCLNCERLQLTCVQHSSDQPSESLITPRAITGIKRKRTFRVCIPCRQSKIKCTGERPICSRCKQKSLACAYDGDAAEPAWTHAVTPSSQQHPDTPSVSPPRHVSSVPSVAPQGEYPSSLSWLFARELPPRSKLHQLLDAYFNNVHPIRVFAFVHKPSFMRMLDESLVIDSANRALLHIMCAHAAKFHVLEYSESTSPLPREVIQAAGSQWAKIAEEMYFSDYSTISVVKLKVLVLLHDHEARLGNYAGSFLLTGLIVRMAHALQIHVESEEQPGVTNDVSLRESRRRLMWACYMVDVWAGSGVDQLTILNEMDIKLQLPCNERQFLLQIPHVTETLRPGEVLDPTSTETIPGQPWENMGMSGYFVRIAYIWKRVLRYIKHLDAVHPPWVPNAEFEALNKEIEEWKYSHPQWMSFSSDNIYIRRESSQLGALFIIHCMYHHVLCDLHRIALPNLFKMREPFEFPPEQFGFMAKLQTTCFENAQRVSVLTSTILKHGVKYLADPILPSFVYNSSRIMLYYIARILDRSKQDAEPTTARTLELVELNNRALRAMSQMYPLAEPLYVTTERWLDKVRESIARGAPLDPYIPPQDPVDPHAEARPTPSVCSPPNTETSHIPVTRMVQRPINDHLNPMLNIAAPPPTTNEFATTNTYPYSITTPSGPIALDPEAMQDISPPQTDQIGNVYYPGMENIEQPMFDLNDLQNFFEWENSENGPPPTGVDGLGPLGWNNLSSMQ